MIKKVLIISILAVASIATSINDFIDTKQCDQIVDKQVFKVCYDYKIKGARAVWYGLDGRLVNAVNIKKRPHFYSERTIPVRYRAKYKDYTHSGYDRGHMANDADFDYDIKVLRKTYSMCNITPQTPKLNRKTWIKAEKYERSVAAKLGSAKVINLVFYPKNPKRIGKNRIAVPSGFLKVVYNNSTGLERCFWYDNRFDIDVKTDRLKNHLVDCGRFNISQSRSSLLP